MEIERTLTHNDQLKFSRLTEEIKTFIGGAVETRTAALSDTLRFVSDRLTDLADTTDPASAHATIDAIQDVIAATLSESGEKSRQRIKKAERVAADEHRRLSEAEAARSQTDDRAEALRQLAIKDWEREKERCQRLNLRIPEHPDKIAGRRG